MVGDVSGVLRLATHALSCCRFWCRLGWPDLLDHPFVRETDTERLVREKALADAMELADSSRGWKVRRAAAHEAVNQGLAWDTVLMCAGLDCTVTMLDDRSGAATLGVACCWSHEEHQLLKNMHKACSQRLPPSAPCAAIEFESNARLQHGSDSSLWQAGAVHGCQGR